MEGNQMKMREALEHASYFLRRHHMGAVYAPDGETLIFCEDVAKIVDAALSAPPRNCDVGTAEEQTERFKKLCRKYRRGPGPRTNCKGCPVSIESQHVGCTFAWAQMPYKAEKGEADGV